jgi:hypothetical protein
MNVRTLFAADSRRAVSATPGRRLASLGSFILLAGGAILLGQHVSPWVWPCLVVMDILIFAVLGNRWANQDAHRAAVPEGRDRT